MLARQYVELQSRGPDGGLQARRRRHNDGRVKGGQQHLLQALAGHHLQCGPDVGGHLGLRQRRQQLQGGGGGYRWR